MRALVLLKLAFMKKLYPSMVGNVAEILIYVS